MKRAALLLVLAACGPTSQRSGAPAAASSAPLPSPAPVTRVLTPDAGAPPAVVTLGLPFGVPIPGRTTPGEISVAWNGQAGLVTNSERTLLKDDVEGDSDFDAAVIATLDETGQARQPWKSALGPPGQRVIAATGLPTKDEYFSVRAAALPGPTLVVAAQSYGSSASHSCHGGAWIVGLDAPLANLGVDGCAVEPLIRGGGQGERQAVFAFGRDYAAHNAYMNELNEGHTNVKMPVPTAVLMVRAGAETWRRIQLQTARSVGVVAVGPSTVAIGSHETGAKGNDAVAVVLVPWAGGRDQRIEIERGNVGEPALAWVGTNLVVVYAARAASTDPYRLQSATVTAAGVVTRHGAFGPPSAVAPALSAAGDQLALAFTEETKPSRVHLGCGRGEPSALPTSVVSAPDVRARDPELALAPDGRSGALAFHAFTAKSSRVHTSAFRCGL